MSSESKTQDMVPLIIKSALMFSVLLYGFVAGISQQQNWQPLSGEDFYKNSMVLVFLIIALMVVTAGKVLGGKFREAVVIERDSNGRPQLSSEGRGKFFIAMILELALYESCALLGLVLSFTQKNPSMVLPFALMALVMMTQVPHKPTANEK